MAAHRLLLVYTGGTIGMIQPPGQAYWIPFNFNVIREQLPELSRFSCEIDWYSPGPPLDSSDLDPQNWIELAQIISNRYTQYDSFVILHGTDTMAFTASALSFLLSGIKKPVILTGSQLPIGEIRNDARENLVTAIEIASTCPWPLQEVCIYFDYRLIRGNRAHKKSVQQFDAFESTNFPVLAEAGTRINWFKDTFLPVSSASEFNPFYEMNTQIAVLKFFPGIRQEYIHQVLTIPGLQGVILESFGAGNLPIRTWLFDELSKAIQNGILVLNITQCEEGQIEPGKYATSKTLQEIGVISGGDMTFEAATTKLMYICAKTTEYSERKNFLLKNLCGEITIER